MRPNLTSLTIRGFKTIRELKDFDRKRPPTQFGAGHSEPRLVSGAKARKPAADFV